ncbi:hypothetical protein ASE00_22685 [Sphingomonas sp. Root710]|nr:hypothetical protein ASE00_22685 [Sphingomonas sp. Root710]
MGGSHSQPALPTDLNAVRAKYVEERNKRVRAEGVAQFVAVEGALDHLMDDPFVPERVSRNPQTAEVDVVVVGAGHCGLLAAVRLKQAGIDNIRIIDGAADFGGTWYWNRYPGIRCDVDAYIYMPLLEEVGYVPTEKYASGTEIFRNAQRIGATFGLYDKALFQTHVDLARWDEEIQRWTVSTNRGDKITARFVIFGLGPLNRPKLPGIPGLTSFKGHMFHTSRWDYNYTGGSSEKPESEMVKLCDKRVAIVGTGCTGIQCAPRVAEFAKHLYVFQRTPSAVAERANRPTNPEWESSLAAGWQKRRSDNFDRVMQGLPEDEDLVNDGWTEMRELMAAAWAGTVGETKEAQAGAQRAEAIDLEMMNRIRTRVDLIVEDHATAERLKPWYNRLCKRPTFSDHYLQMFNRPNVDLVDTNGHGVECIEERGLIVDGKLYEVDCIIFASGFEVGTDYSRRGDIKIIGRNGITLSEKWSGGMKTLYGYLSSGYPNCFHMGAFLQNAAFGNFTAVFDRQASRIAEIIVRLNEAGAKTIEASAAGEDAWVAAVRESYHASEPFLAQCTPGYYNGEGKTTDGILYEQYNGGVTRFEEIVQKWIDDGLSGAVVR